MPFELNTLRQKFKSNLGAIITAIITFLIVFNYLLFVIPENEERIDKYNFSCLDEFSKQFNLIIKDHVNAFKLTDLNINEPVLKYNESLKIAGTCKNCNDPFPKKLYNTYFNSKTTEFQNYFLIKNIKVDNIVNYKSELRIFYTIDLKRITGNRDSAELISLLKKYNFEDNTSIISIPLYKDIKKKEIKERLKGAIPFNNWMIYLSDDISNFSDNEILTNNIRNNEYDSLKLCKLFNKGIKFINSEKRFYKQTYKVEGKELDVVFIAAINQQAFEHKAKEVKSENLIACIVITLLLFLLIPILKPLISDSHEKLSQWDIFNVTLAISMIALIISSYIFNSYLTTNHKNRTNEKLRVAANTLDSTFNEDFRKYNDLFKCISSNIKSNSDSVIRIDIETYRSLIKPHCGFHEILLDSYKINKHHLQNYFLMNHEGDLVKDLFVNNPQNFRKNFKDRDYIKIFNNDSLYSDVFSSVYSKNDNIFRVIYVKKEKIAVDNISRNIFMGFCYVSSLMKPLKKPEQGYGYLICNVEGRVIFHSDTLKSLNENIYINSHRSPDLLKLFRGGTNSYFELDYNGEPCRFYGKRLYYSDSKYEFPIFLLTFKKLEYENNLTAYTILNGILLITGFFVIMTLLIIFYSIIYNINHVPIISRFHIHWLFPDKSRKKEYAILSFINLITGLILISLLIIGLKNLLYYSVVIGINLSFFAFILLSQRHFSLMKKDKNNFLLLVGYITYFVITLLIGYYFQKHEHAFIGIGVIILIQLFLLRLIHKLLQKNLHIFINQEFNNQTPYFGFMTSAIMLNYIIIPMIALFSIYSIEENNILSFVNSYNKDHSHEIVSTEINRSPINEAFFDKLTLLEKPSLSSLNGIGFINYQEPTNLITGLADLITTHEKSELFVFFISIGILLILIYYMIRLYSNRFFFFDLSIMSNHPTISNEDKNIPKNNNTFLPPFDDKDLEHIIESSKLDGNNLFPENNLFGDIKESTIPYETRIDFIIKCDIKANKLLYESLWNSLTTEEKFVLFDFAEDHFVNYSNKGVIMQLMQKGLIVSDKLTGRLRVMNYGFNKYIVKQGHNDPDLTKQISENRNDGNYIKWRLPIIIVAISLLLLMMYLYKQKFDYLILIAGSIFSAIGLIVKFIDSYKKVQ